MKQSMQVLTSQQSVEWYTPSGVIELARKTLGGTIDLDPASNAYAQRWIKANRHYDFMKDGLRQTWQASTIWLNPPFDNAPAWAAKMVAEYQAGNFEQGILLINSALGYKWYEDLWRQFTVCCLRDRIRFVNERGETNGQAKRGQTIVYMGSDWDTFYRHWSPYGRILLSEGLSQHIVEDWLNDS